MGLTDRQVDEIHREIDAIEKSRVLPHNDLTLLQIRVYDLLSGFPGGIQGSANDEDHWILFN